MGDERIFSPLDDGLADLFEPEDDAPTETMLPETMLPETMAPTGPVPPVEAPSSNGTTSRPSFVPAAGTSTSAVPAASSPSPPLRPTLFPQQSPSRSRSKGRRKTTRVAAMPPDPNVDLAAEDEPRARATLDDDSRHALEAFVALPRPVFTSDLVAATGSDAVVAAWEDECRAMAESPVRFIPPKKRHRLRGPLVIPYDLLRDAASEFDNGWWAEVMRKYRGGRVYELGVLLHRVGEQVISYRFDDTVAVLRLNQPRGIVGVCVLLENTLAPGEPTREAMVAAVEELLRDRLDLLVVLTTYGEPVERVVQPLLEDAAARNWQPTQPIVAAHSWEYADSNNSTFVHVIG
jgi:hypothetical protein